MILRRCRAMVVAGADELNLLQQVTAADESEAVALPGMACTPDR
jgi:hypothetical protein